MDFTRIPEIIYSETILRKVILDIYRNVQNWKRGPKQGLENFDVSIHK